MSQYQTLILNQFYRPHEVVEWKDAVTAMFKGTVEVLVQYDEVLAHIDRQTLATFPELRRALRQVIGTDAEELTIKVPAVLVLRRKTSHTKSGVKFSKINVCLRDNFSCQYCLTPDHRILTADLRWVNLGDLRVNDALVGFEETPASKGGRRYQPSIVVSHEFSSAPVYQVLLENGITFKTTAEHKWLARSKEVTSLKWYDTKHILGKRLPRLFDTWDCETTYGAGWLSGILDGEGWLRSGVGMLGRVQTSDYVKVTAVTLIGVQQIVKMRTSTGTFIAEGYPHHNCGDKLPMSQLNYDHVIPRAKGGKTTWANIVASCFSCNGKKGSKLAHEAGMKLLSVPVQPKVLPMNEPFIDPRRAPPEWEPYIKKSA